MTHQAIVTTPLGEEALLLRHMSGSEGLSQLFTFDLTLYSNDEEINIDDILGQNITLQLSVDGEGKRYFNGYVSQFSYVDRAEEGQVVYLARVSPWLWFLTRTSDCRIYQEMTVVEIIKSVFADNGFSGDVKDLLVGSFRKWEYCVQYRETDFNFVSRLMEQEGIYYYFEHDNGHHVLVLANDRSSHSDIKGEVEIPYHEPGISHRPETERVSNWQLQCSIQSDKLELADYNFETPKKKLRALSQIAPKHANKGHEIFDYPGEYSNSSDAEQYSRTRLEELQAGFEQVTGESNARAITSGGLFRLVGHPRKDQDREYLVLNANYEISVGPYTSGVADDGPVYVCHFSAIDSKVQFRPSRLTPKPIVQGPQTAVVVGESGEEIDPDEFGRVKVQFHWDRYGENDGKNSCWIRVAQSWAGAGWGAQFIPRIGHEVLVEFLEGDPDRPLITGGVYNADNKPPYSLPGNKTQSGIKSRTTMSGGESNFNEIRMDDKKGKEELFIQAEKDKNINVKNCKKETIGKDETVSIGNDRKVDVGSNDTLKVGKALKITAGNEIQFKTGAASISMKNSGDITIKNEAGTININPGGLITIKGTLVKIN